jgi:protein TonB
MSTPAYSTSGRRYARHFVRDVALDIKRPPKKSADIVVLVPRQQKLLAVAPRKNNVGTLVLTLLGVGVIHVALGWYVYSQPEPQITSAEIPPMTVEFYRPPVEQPQPPQPKDEPPPPVPEPVVEKPKPVVKAVEKIPEPVAQVVVPEPTPTPPPTPVLTKAHADAGYLRNPAPRYPEFAQDKGWEGTVLLNVHVLPNGKPKAVEIKQSSGRKILDDSAIQAVKRWSFVPAKLGDIPTESWVEVPIDFRLSN